MLRLHCWLLIFNIIFVWIFFAEADICEPVFNLLGDKSYQANFTIGKNVILADWLNKNVKPDLQKRCFPHVVSMITSRFRGPSRFFGTIPSAMGLMTSLGSLSLRKSSLSGQIPDFFKNLTSLNSIDIGGNCISGMVDSLCRLAPSLAEIQATSNNLAGTLPPCLNKMSNLEKLYLSSNAISGSIPPYFSNFNQLTMLEIGAAELTGTLPNFVKMESLNYLYLPNNKFSGTLPSTLIQMDSLQDLVLYENHLTGGLNPIRNVFRRVSLDHNHLTGTVPANFSASYFDVKDNRLTGTMPSSLCQPEHPGVKYYFQGNDGLCIACTMSPAMGTLTADPCDVIIVTTTTTKNAMVIIAEGVAPAVMFVVALVLGAGLSYCWWQRSLKNKKIPLNAAIDWATDVQLKPLAGAFFIPFQQFQLGPIIASGAAGNVYRATFGGRPVAMKELIATLFDPTDKRALASLEAEASLLCSLQHPNIVRFYGMTGKSTPRGNSYYLVTDLKALDLRELMMGDQPEQLEVLRMAKEISDALEFLHSVEVVHRDLKPANVLLDESRTVSLCDFGISKRTTEAANLTLNVGTAAYMAPELGKADDFDDDMSDGDESNDDLSPNKLAELGPRMSIAHLPSFSAQPGDDTERLLSNESKSSGYGSTGNISRTNSSRHLKTPTRNFFKVDCFSFGMLLWAMLSWKLPFKDSTQFQILSALAVHNKRPSTKAMAKQWPRALVVLVKTLWATDPDDRPTVSEAKAVLVEQMSVKHASP